MNLANSVFELAEKFMKDSQYVNINYKKITYVSEILKQEDPPKIPNHIDKDNAYKTCLLELVGDSINYCYWHGRSYIRPRNASSTKLHKIISKSFENFDKNGGINSFDRCLDKVIKYISIERFPMLEERIKHLNELRNNGKEFIKKLTKNPHNVHQYLLDMIQIFPGYASDMFLKRAVLFFSQLNRMFGWFEKDMYNLPAPADYQVPKMLEYYDILEYDEDLLAAIEREILIPKGSLAECEIRSATIIACRQLGQELGWSMPQVDGYFWLSRKEVTTPFHLTITTDY